MAPVLLPELDMRARLVRLVFPLTLALGTAAVQGPPCPFSGLTKVEYGPGGPPFDYPKFELTLDPAGCTLETKFVPDPNRIIGNYYLTGNFLIYGDFPLTPGLPLGEPFFGFELLVLPLDVLGPFPGNAASLPVPPDPLLLGRTFYFQDIARYMYTLSLPPGIDYILTYGIAATIV
jgi:hypothetical protein